MEDEVPNDFISARGALDKTWMFLVLVAWLLYQTIGTILAVLGMTVVYLGCFMLGGMILLVFVWIPAFIKYLYLKVRNAWSTPLVK